MTRLIFTQPNGTVAVVIPAPDSGLSLADIAARTVPEGTPYEIVPAESVPADRTYRNAWVADLIGGSITHDMPKAREIHKNYMRAARTPLLSALDVAYTRADELGPAGAAQKAQIAAQKQALRDVTADPGIETATTPAALKAVWPGVLGTNPLPQG